MAISSSEAMILAFMQDLDGIRANGGSSRVESGEHGGDIDTCDSSEEKKRGPVELDRPAEGLLIYHEDQDERHDRSEEQADGAREQAEQTGFTEDDGAHLLLRCSQET